MKQGSKKSGSTSYDHKYFMKRDVLDVPIAEGIKKFMLEHRLIRILDVGCGTGKIVKFLNESGFDAYGCDLSEIAVNMARKLNGQKRIKLASITKLPYYGKNFDLVISISVIEHITKTRVSKFLVETREALKEGGYIFLVTPNFASPLRLILEKKWAGFQDPTHINFYTPTTLATTLKVNGFSQPTTNISLPRNKIAGTSFLKNVFYYLFFSTRLKFVRNSFWIAARSLPKPPDCIQCHARTHPVIETRLPNQTHYFYNECTRCKLVTISPMPTQIPRNLYSFSNPITHGAQVNPQLNTLNHIPGGTQLLKLYIWWCNFFRFQLVSRLKYGGNILDVGCGEGAFLRFFSKTNWQISGIEINPRLAKIAHNTSGAHMYTQPVEKVKMRSSYFDVVTLWHVLEHVIHPKIVLKRITHSLKTGGTLIIEVPQGQAMYRKIFGREWQLLIPPQHLYLWSQESLIDLLHSLGYRIMKVSYFGIMSFSGSSSIANWLRTKNISSPIAIAISFALFPLMVAINILQGNQRENLLVIAQKK